MTAPLEADSLAAEVFDALSSHICVIDSHGEIVAVNRAWRDFGSNNGHKVASTDIGRNYLSICCRSSGHGAAEANDFASGVRSVLAGKAPLFQLEYPCHSPHEWRWFLARVTPLGPKRGGAVVSHMNITDRKLLEFELAKLAATDPLTGLPNRRYFLEAAEREIERVRRFAAPASVVMIDLDHFKAVNDAHGHAAGDAVLRGAPEAWRNVIRKVDILARLGGEEFICLLPGVAAEAATKIAGRLRRILAAARMSVDAQTISVTASFGVAQVWPSDQSIADALGRADTALYNAKREGRNCVRTFAAENEGKPATGGTR
jgi:diguanylate cyclase (GGDEF)-like protein